MWAIFFWNSHSCLSVCLSVCVCIRTVFTYCLSLVTVTIPLPPSFLACIIINLWTSTLLRFVSFVFYALQMFVFLSFCHHTTMCVLLYLSVCLPRRRRRRRWHEKSEQNKRLWSSLWSVWLRWHTKTWSKVSWLPANFLAVIERDVTTYLSRSSERERERRVRQKGFLLE